MNPANPIEQLQEAIRAAHGCDGVHISSTAVADMWKGEMVWRGSVETFILRGHATAKRCHAWFQEEGHTSGVMTILEIPPVNGPHSAVAVARGRATSATTYNPAFTGPK